MRFLVIDSLARASGKRYSTFDVVGAGPRIVAGVIANNGYRVSLKAYEYVVEGETDLDKYDAILISIMSSDKGALEKLLDIIISKKYNGPVIVGGPASFEYEYLLKRYRRIDYVIVGEAEIPLMEMFKYIDEILVGDKNIYGRIPAFAYRVNEKIILTSKHVHTPVELLNKNIPWIRINESYPHYKANRYYVEVVRGCSNFRRPLIRNHGLNCIGCRLCYSERLEKRLFCPANIPPGCGFCSVPYMFGPPRSRSVESILTEIRGLIQFGAHRIVLSAPDFLDYGREKLVEPKPLTDPCYPPPNLEALETLLSELSEISQVANGDVVIMIENIKACLVNDDVAKLLGKYLKDTTIHIGLETGDNEFNERVFGKPITREHVINAVKLLSKYGLRPYIYLMYGFPLMNERVYKQTVNTVKELAKLPVEKITLYKYVNLPGTAFEHVYPDITRAGNMIKYLRKLVNEFNKVKKNEFYSNKVIEVFLVYSNGKYYGYPVKHGPVVFVRGITSKGFDGCRALVKVTDVKERYVHGEFIKITRC